jgi:hypothetical protein
MKLVSIDELKTGDLIKVYSSITKQQFCVKESVFNNSCAVLCVDKGSMFSIFIGKTDIGVSVIDSSFKYTKAKIFVNSRIYQFNSFSYLCFEIVK